MPAPLLPESLWLIIEPLLPPVSPKPKGGRPPVPARAALTGILFVLRTGIPWEMLPAEMGCGSGVTCWRRLRDWQAPGYGTVCTASYWTDCGTQTASIGAAPAWTVRPSRPKKGGRNRSEPDRPRQAGHQTPSDHGSERHPARLFADRGQRSRQHTFRDPSRFCAARRGQARQTEEQTRQAARRQSLRSPPLPASLPASAYQTTYRPARRRDQPEARRTSMGNRTQLRMVQQVQAAHYRYERRLDMHHAFTSIACSIICLRALAGRF